MALVADRVRETTTTTGTGTYTLAGAQTGYRTFTSAFSNATVVDYAITDGTNWEVGKGTFTTSGTTLSRGTIRASSNAGSAVNWGAGTRDIWCNNAAALVPAAGLALFTGPTVERLYTLPDAAATIARTDAAQTFTDLQTFGSALITTLLAGTISGTSCDLTSLVVDGLISGVAGTGAEIPNITPGANFILTQNSVAAITSVETGAVANTLYLSAGKVGIGTNSPQTFLHISGVPDSTGGFLYFSDPTNIAHPFTGLQPTDVFGALIRNGLSGGLIFRGFSENGSTIGLKLDGLIGSANPTDTVPAVQIRGFKSDGGTSIAALGASETVFQVVNNSTILATVLGGGNVGIGTADPGKLLEVNGTLGVRALSTLTDGADGTNTSGYKFVSFVSNSAEAGNVIRVGTTSAVVFTTTSDERMKNVIGESDPVAAIERLMAYRMKKYEWKSQPGLYFDAPLAQQIYSVNRDPTLVPGAINDSWGINMSGFVPDLILAVQHYKSRIEALEERSK